MVNSLIALAEMLPMNEINGLLNQVSMPPIANKDVSMFFVTTTVTQLAIQYTLPMRSIMCGLWYKELNGSIPAQIEKKKSSKRRPSEKLMEESHKNLTEKSKKLDRNILKRAMEKEE